MVHVTRYLVTSCGYKSFVVRSWQLAVASSQLLAVAVHSWQLAVASSQLAVGVRSCSSSQLVVGSW